MSVAMGSKKLAGVMGRRSGYWCADGDEANADDVAKATSTCPRKEQSE